MLSFVCVLERRVFGAVWEALYHKVSVG
jgi:hypothetical protein